MSDNQSLNDKQREMWVQWKTTGNDRYRIELLRSLQPLLKRNIQQYSQYPIPYNTLLTQANILANQAITSYNPAKGAAVSTYVQHNLKPMNRFVKQHQNIKYLPQYLSDYYGKYEATERRLTGKLGREPTQAEIAKDLGLREDEVARIAFAKSPEILSSVFEEDIENLPDDNAWRRYQQDRLAYLRSELSGTELKAFDLITGKNRKPLTNKQEVAQKLDVPVEDIYSMTRRWSRRLDS